MAPTITTNGLADPGSATAAILSAQWAVATGNVNSILAAYPAPNTSLPDGLILGVRASGANTLATPVFAPDGLASAVITKVGGQPLAAGDISGAGHELLLRYNAAAPRWELLNPALGAGTDWTAYTPTVIPGSGTLTAASAVGSYRKSGKTVQVVIAITITTNGTGAGFIAASLPFNTTQQIALTGMDVSAPIGLAGYFNTTQYAICLKVDGTYPGANGKVLLLSGTYISTV